MLIFLLFIIISALFAIEASTSLARVAGINANNLASGLQLQSGLSLFSRALMSIFMPMLGAMADAGTLNEQNLVDLYYSTALIPIAICATYKFKVIIIKVYNSIAMNLIARGSYLPISMSKSDSFVIGARDIYRLRKLNTFRMVTLFSYFPYYLSWPVIILLLSYYPNDRGLIIGLSSIMNGINTLALVLYVDPYLIKLSKHKKLSNLVYQDQIRMRAFASMLAFTPFVFALLYYYSFR